LDVWYLPETEYMRLGRLDGIRALAILLVFSYHHFLGGLGWVGVDIFFVLSGYLITGILLRSGADQHYWQTFYLKRSTRILPPLFVLFIATVALSHHVSKVGLVGYALFAGNLVNMSPYIVAGLVALWSLAIEEHFYIFWPFFTRYVAIWKLVWILAIVAFTEPVLRVLAMLVHLPPMSTYYLTPFRLDGLVLGALLAVGEITGRGKPFLSRYGGWISLVLWGAFILISLLFPFFTRESGSYLFNAVGYSLISAASAAGIGYVAWNPQSIVSRILGFSVFAWIGRISYGMYLYHGVILSVTRHLFHVPPGTPGGTGTRLLTIVDLPLTLLVSWISFRCLETPLIDWARQKTRGDEPARAHRFD
jgi:peptidoglycan/LPS O-acetylase OafA/YrhL